MQAARRCRITAEVVPVDQEPVPLGRRKNVYPGHRLIDVAHESTQRRQQITDMALDGAGIVSGLHPPARRLYDAIARIPYSGIVIFVLLIKVVPYLFWPVFDTVNRQLPYPFRFS